MRPSPDTTGSSRASRIAVCLVALTTLALSVMACGSEARRTFVYIERIDPALGLTVDRTHAVRLTVFEYGPRVGGFIEYFEIDEVFNTRFDPYFRPASCTYFGESPVRNQEFRIDAQGVASQPLVASARWTGSRRAPLELTVFQWGGLFEAGVDPAAVESVIALERDVEHILERSCP